MLFYVIGVPGRFAEWCETATARLVRHAYGAAELIRADTLEEVTRCLLRSGASHGVVAAHQPGGRIRRALVEAARPFIVVRGDPWTSLSHLIARRGVTLPAGTRQVASSCASIFGFCTTARALAVEGDDGDLLATARTIADHLQFEIADVEIAELVREIGLGGAGSGPGISATWRDNLDPGERAIANGAFAPYLDGSTGGWLGPITWAPELFFAGDRPGAPATGGVDITGRARCLLRGPHILLPPANWLLSMTLDVSPEAAEHTFVVEATAGTVVGRAVIRPTDAGEVEANLTLALEELPDQPVDLLLSNERPAFGGHLTLLGVTLTPQPPALADVLSKTAKDGPLFSTD